MKIRDEQICIDSSQDEDILLPADKTPIKRPTVITSIAETPTRFEKLTTQVKELKRRRLDLDTEIAKIDGRQAH